MGFDPATLKYDAQGLIPAIAQDETGDVLMMAWMNAESVARTLDTGKVTYWSRSRAAFWVKGETSGHRQALVEMRVDCDRDCLLVIVAGGACLPHEPTVVFLHGGAGGRRGGDPVADDVMLPRT